MIKASQFYSSLFAITMLAVSGCASVTDPYALENRAHYWQRSSTTSAIYQRGVKAQQMLNRDISRCVAEIEEMERLGQVQNALPEDYHNPNDHVGNTLRRLETPERIGALRTEILPYHDFEACMKYQGWERTKYVPYEAAIESRNNYIENIRGEEWRSDYAGNPVKPGSSAEMHYTEDPDFQGLNN